MDTETADSDTLRARSASIKIAISPAIDTDMRGMDIPVACVGDPHLKPKSSILYNQ
jgi:hypothetical protein